jgi:hypothetical protein
VAERAARVRAPYAPTGAAPRTSQHTRALRRATTWPTAARMRYNTRETGVRPTPNVTSVGTHIHKSTPRNAHQHTRGAPARSRNAGCLSSRSITRAHRHATRTRCSWAGAHRVTCTRMVVATRSLYVTRRAQTPAWAVLCNAATGARGWATALRAAARPRLARALSARGRACACTAARREARTAALGHARAIAIAHRSAPIREASAATQRPTGSAAQATPPAAPAMYARHAWRRASARHGPTRGTTMITRACVWAHVISASGP